MRRLTQDPPNVKPPRDGKSASNRDRKDADVVPIDRGKRQGGRKNVAVDFNRDNSEELAFYDQDIWTHLDSREIRSRYEGTRDDSDVFRPKSWPDCCLVTLNFITESANVSRAIALGLAIDLGRHNLIKRLHRDGDKSGIDYLQQLATLSRIVKLDSRTLPATVAGSVTREEGCKIAFTLPAAGGDSIGLGYGVRVVKFVMSAVNTQCGLIGAKGYEFATICFMQTAVDLLDYEGNPAANSGHRKAMTECLNDFVEGVECKARMLAAILKEFGLMKDEGKRK